MKVIDGHLHLYDSSIVEYEVFQKNSPDFEAFVGNYDALPRKVSLQDYLQQAGSINVEGLVWHEFMPKSPRKELDFIIHHLNDSPLPFSLVTSFQCLSPTFEEDIEYYQSINSIHCVREHLVYHPKDPNRRFADSPNILKNAKWRSQFKRFSQYSFKIGLEVFSHQLEDLFDVISENENIYFILALMGWPIDLTQEGFKSWKKQIAKIANLPNVSLSISALECIFGLDWTVAQVKPWTDFAINSFGCERTVFGSHAPITYLGHHCKTLEQIYKAYSSLIREFSKDEQQAMLCTNVKNLYQVS